MPVNWTTCEDAIRAWVLSATGLGQSKVIWSEQTGKRPDGDFITVRLGDLVPLGAVDEVEDLTDLGRPAGQEIEERVIGVREFPVSIQAFTGSVTGTANARALLSKVQTALALPSVRDALEAAGISPYDAGQVQNITALAGTKFEGRAVLEVRFYTLESVSEFVGYINTVESTSYMGPPSSGTKDAIDI